MPKGRGTLGAKLIGLLAALAVTPAVAAPQADGQPGPSSGLPVPRFVSIKSERVNVRSGPNRENQVDWIYTRVGLPVEIIGEYDNWRHIRDWEGSEGWVLHSLLSGRRTVLVAAVAKKVDDVVAIHSSADPKSAITARLQSGVLATVKRCDGQWCRISGQGFDGWIEEERLWGVYPGEKVDD
jgi:SH3-like domain-containing protein